MGDWRETKGGIDCSNSMHEGSVNTEGLTAGPGIMPWKNCEYHVMKLDPEDEGRRNFKLII